LAWRDGKGKTTKSVHRTSAAETNISGFYFIAQRRGRAYFLIYISLIFIWRVDIQTHRSWPDISTFVAISHQQPHAVLDLVFVLAVIARLGNAAGSSDSNPNSNSELDPESDSNSHYDKSFLFLFLDMFSCSQVNQPYRCLLCVLPEKVVFDLKSYKNIYTSTGRRTNL